MGDSVWESMLTAGLFPAIIQDGASSIPSKGPDFPQTEISGCEHLALCSPEHQREENVAHRGKGKDSKSHKKQIDTCLTQRSHSSQTCPQTYEEMYVTQTQIMSAGIKGCSGTPSLLKVDTRNISDRTRTKRLRRDDISLLRSCEHFVGDMEMEHHPGMESSFLDPTTRIVTPKTEGVLEKVSEVNTVCGDDRRRDHDFVALVPGCLFRISSEEEGRSVGGKAKRGELETHDDGDASRVRNENQTAIGENELSARIKQQACERLLKLDRKQKSRAELQEKLDAMNAEDLGPFLDTSVRDAAKELGVNVAYLKAHCRRLGLNPWPTHKIQNVQQDVEKASVRKVTSFYKPREQASKIPNREPVLSLFSTSLQHFSQLCSKATLKISE